MEQPTARTILEDLMPIFKDKKVSKITKDRYKISCAITLENRYYNFCSCATKIY